MDLVHPAPAITVGNPRSTDVGTRHPPRRELIVAVEPGGVGSCCDGLMVMTAGANGFTDYTPDEVAFQ